MQRQNSETQKCSNQFTCTYLPVLIQPMLSLNCFQPIFNNNFIPNYSLNSTNLITLSGPESNRNPSPDQKLSNQPQFPHTSPLSKSQSVSSSKPQLPPSEPLKPSDHEENGSKPTYNLEEEPKEPKKTNWSEDQDKHILEMVSLFGKQWKHISQQFPGRTSKQIRQRYLNYLRPNISHERWTPEQDKQLMELVRKYGKHWNIIQKFITTRSQNQLKNRFYGKLKKFFQDQSN